MKNNIAVWCNTEEKAEKFIEYAKSIGLTWYGFSIFGYACYDKYKSDTCYCLSDTGNSIQYSGIDYFKEVKFDIIEFEDFTKSAD